MTPMKRLSAAFDRAFADDTESDDVYVQFAADIFNVEVATVTDKMRQFAVLAARPLLYGASGTATNKVPGWAFKGHLNAPVPAFSEPKDTRQHSGDVRPESQGGLYPWIVVAVENPPGIPPGLYWYVQAPDGERDSAYTIVQATATEWAHSRKIKGRRFYASGGLEGRGADWWLDDRGAIFKGMN